MFWLWSFICCILILYLQVLMSGWYTYIKWKRLIVSTFHDIRRTYTLQPNVIVSYPRLHHHHFCCCFVIVRSLNEVYMQTFIIVILRTKWNTSLKISVNYLKNVIWYQKIKSTVQIIRTLKGWSTLTSTKKVPVVNFLY